jgi:hypothetical protein
MRLDTHTDARTKAHARTHAQQRAAWLKRRRSHARECARAHSHVRYSPMSIVVHTHSRTDTRKTNTLARWQPDTRSHLHPHMCAHTRMHDCTQTDTGQERRRLAPRERVCTAGTRRSMKPLTTGTRRLRRRCLRTAPTCTRTTMSSGAAAGRYFGQRSACAVAGRGRPGRDRCNAVLDAPTGTRAIHSITHARIDVAVCMRLDTHTFASTKAHARTRAQQRAAWPKRRRSHARECARAHSHVRYSPMSIVVHTHSRTDTRKTNTLARWQPDTRSY